MNPLVSVVVPMFNEQENAANTVRRIGEELHAAGLDYEIVPVNDGSLDGTAEALEAIAEKDARVRPVIYRTNRGRGYALRRGFSAAKGRYIAALDADLSYTPDHAVRMFEMLLADPEIDVVLASPYMPGGRVEGVPANRLWVSKLGNSVLRRSLPKPVHTSTCVVRAYRREVLDAMDLASDGKEIHLEVLSNAMALGCRIEEMPATLKARQKGKSKFKPRKTMQSHLAFTLLERSANVFAAFGAALLVASVVLGGYLLTVFFAGRLNPERPLMTVMLLFFFAGAISLSFSLLAMQMLETRRAIVRLQAEVASLRPRGEIED